MPTERRSRSVQAARSGEREGAGKVGLPSITSLFGVGFDMTGRIKSHSQGEEATETKVVREHTEASLFNLLREVLKGHDDFMEILNPSQLEQVNAGQLVEVSGEIVGNPLEQVPEVVGRVLPYVRAEEDESQTVSSPPNRAARRNQARKPQQARQVEETPPEGFDQSGWKIFQVMRDDVEKARVRDLVLKFFGRPKGNSYCKPRVL